MRTSLTYAADVSDWVRESASKVYECMQACEAEELEKRLQFLAQFPEDAKNRAPLDERVLELLQANPSSSARELANTLDVSPRHMQRVMKQLQESGKLRHIGPRKGGRWEAVSGRNV